MKTRRSKKQVPELSDQDKLIEFLAMCLGLMLLIGSALKILFF